MHIDGDIPTPSPSKEAKFTLKESFKTPSAGSKTSKYSSRVRIEC